MHQSGKIICLIIFTLFVLGNGQIPPEFRNSSQEYDFSGDVSKFFLEPLPNPDEISGNVVGPKKIPGVNFTSIQDALDKSIPGSTVYVLSGDYKENLNLSKPGVILRGVDTGEGTPVVSAVGHSSTITITASACTVDGFVVMNSGNPEAGILVFSDGNRISNNSLKNNKGYGIHSKGKSSNIIYGNNINNNGFDGIYLENSSNNSILYNSVTENGINGIYLKDSNNNILKGNEIIKNSKYDVLLENSNNNIIIDNSYDSLKEINSQDNINQGNTNPKENEPTEIPPTEPDQPNEILFLQVLPGGNIQQAINSVSPGGSIQLSGGTYSGPIVIDKANIAILGDGLAEIQGNGVDSTITLSGSGATLSGLVVTGSGNPHAGIDIRASNCLIRGCQITNNHGYGVSIISSSGNRITDDTIADNGLGGIIMESGQNNQIDLNRITRNGARNNGHGVSLQSSSGNNISGNTVTDSSNTGIRLFSSSGNTIYQNTLDNANNAWSNSVNNWGTPTAIGYKGNTTYVGNSWSDYAGWDCNGDGIGDQPYPIPGGSEQDSFPLTERTGTILTVCASGCSFTSIQAAIDAACPGDTIEVESGTYSGPIVIDKANIAIMGEGSPEIQGNGVDSTITLSGSGATLSGLVVTGSGNPHAGIDVRASNCLIRGCQIRDNHGYGISIISSSGTRITDDTIANNGLGGIIMESCRNNQIDLNEITSNGPSNGGHGVSLQSSSENTILDNLATGNDVGIYLASSSGNTIYQNTLDNANNAWSNSANNWHSPTKIEYKGNTTYIGNNWSDYAGWDCNGDGIGDSSYPIPGGSEQDSFPLTERTGTRTLTVCASGCNFTSIQDAINAACPGDTIEVESGTYYEHVNVNKTLILSGVGSPIVDGSSTGNAITMNADGCTIQGFMARNSGNSGIYVTSSGNTISGNTATGNYVGIFLSSSCSNIISGNTANNNSRTGIYLASSSNSNTISDNLASSNEDINEEGLYAAGIYLDSSCSNIISGNTANNNSRTGIYLASSSNSNTISDNLASGSLDGISLDSSCSNIISDNLATGNEAGISLDSSSNSNTILGNTANNNYWCGIYLDSSCKSNTISGNTAINNSWTGIFLDSSCNNTISDNLASGNENGICLFFSSDSNTISDNLASGNENGIYLYSTSSNIISANTFKDNSDGIRLGSSSNNTISANAVKDNLCGIRFDSSSDNNTISSNTIECNKAEMNLSIGIILQSSSDNTMDGNTIRYNRYGINLQSTSNSNTISNNRATNNSISGICLESSNSNTIFGNHFDSANSDGHNQWNTAEKVNYYYHEEEYYNYTGNYWSDYEGSDPDHDGIGNAPYSIDGESEKDNYPLLEDGALTISDSIQISQEGSLQTGQPSSNAQYVLMVTNLGDSELTNISITDQLSKGIAGTFVESGPDPDISQEEENGTRTLLWQDPGPLRPGETKEINLVALMDDELPETLISKASVQATSEDGQKQSDEDTLELNAAANISIEKEADPSFAQPSDQVTFRINITNTGQKELVSVLVNDNLPNGISYVSDDRNATSSGDLVSWRDLGPMQPGESKFISMIGMVKDDVSGMQTNTVSVKANTTRGGTVFASDRADVDILSLSVSKQADKKTVKRGENITYTITICNTGSLPLDNVIAWDALDSQVILLYSSMETEKDGKWHLGTLAPGECAVITLMVQVPKTNLKFDMTSSVSGGGYVNVADDYSTTLPQFVIKNTVRALSSSTKKQIQDTSLVTVLGEAGTELSSREHGSGLYQSEDEIRMIMENKSIQMNKSVTARLQPVVLKLYDRRTINSTSPWTERTQARNRITGTSMTGSFSHAQNISLESHIKLDENESVMEQSSEFDGLGRFGLQKKQVDGKTSLLDILENYAGSFKVYQKIDEYGSSVISKKSASGSGFVAGDRRIGDSQRSHESGTGNYSSQEEIQTYTNYIYKDINLTAYPVGLNPTISSWPNQSLNWSEGIYSRDPGSTYLGEEYRNLEDMEKQTLVMGLNIIQTESNFTGSASYRQAMKGEMDLEQEYIGKYSIRQKTSIKGTARFDRPHINVIKDGEIISQSNPSKTYARYKIAVENDGNKMLSPVYVKDLFPPGALYVNSSLRPSLTSSSANWTLTNLPVGGRSEIILWLEMGEDPSGTLVNRVEASGSHDAGWAYASNITVTKGGWLELPPTDDLIMVKKSVYVNKSASDLVWYHLSIENLCNCTTSLIVTDSLPQGMKLVEATPDITSFDRESNTITWNVISLKPQGTMSIVYKVMVTKGGRLVNQVKVEAVSLEGCDILPAYDSAVLTIGNKSSVASSGDWMPPEDWDLQCSGTSCP